MLTQDGVEYTGFIRGLLENVGAEIDPIRLIRRIKNGLEIPGLKLALIKILQDFNLQVRACVICSDMAKSTSMAHTVHCLGPDLVDGGLQEHPVQRLSSTGAGAARRADERLPVDRCGSPSLSRNTSY